ncbi:MAG: nucleoside-diphosphate sugar epimerase/dehydratase, partial [Syntrophomonas sp.]|nr:nucleoside-diphosphate sugar epimerase/dehydratase [Syntrophomonas sp.]
AIPLQYSTAFLSLIPVLTGVNLLFMVIFKLYNRMWNYASIGELSSILGASSCSIVVVVALIKVLSLPELPRSVYIMSWVAVTLFIGASRLGWRLFRDYHLKTNRGRKRVLIVGAGDAGAMLVREIQSNPHLGLEAMAFVDDESSKIDRIMMGVPVKGTRLEIPCLVEDLQIDEIIIAMPSVERRVIREIVDICKLTSASLKILPNIYLSSSKGANLVSHLRDVKMEDLLGRDPVAIDLMQVSGYIHNKTVLITGGGGSIGSELCRQIARFKPKLLVVLDYCENNLFDIEQELIDLEIEAEIAMELLDVKHRDTLEDTFRKYLPQIIFHAAAYKHVPIMERHPQEALYNNVLGTRNVAELADKYGAESFILISTDKAVNPTSVMGATKRIAELIIKDINLGSATRFAAVRFGNVLGSRGSVIPTFKKQIERGGPVTITHQDMKRYFMTIPEAVELVIQAGAMTTGGEIFVLDMGEPVKIVDMAKDMIKLCGLEPGQDIEIKFTGIRPGEKLYEELFSGREEMAATRHERIFISKKELDQIYSGINNSIYTRFMNAAPDNEAIINLIAGLIPEYQKPQHSTISQMKAKAGPVVYMQEAHDQRKLGS